MPVMQMEMRLGGRGKPRVPSADDAEELVAALAANPALCRRPAAEVAAALGGWSDRRLRSAAEASCGAVLSAPGCVGYRLASETPVESYYEVERARYRSQIREMEARLCAMDRAVHAAGKGRAI